MPSVVIIDFGILPKVEEALIHQWLDPLWQKWHKNGTERFFEKVDFVKF